MVRNLRPAARTVIHTYLWYFLSLQFWNYNFHTTFFIAILGNSLSWSFILHTLYCYVFAIIIAFFEFLQFPISLLYNFAIEMPIVKCICMYVCTYVCVCICVLIQFTVIFDIFNWYHIEWNCCRAKWSNLKFILTLHCTPTTQSYENQSTKSGMDADCSQLDWLRHSNCKACRHTHKNI